MQRNDQKKEHTWDLTSFFEDKKKWQQKLSELIKESESKFSKIQYLDLSKTSKDEVKEVLDNFFSYMRDIEGLYVYAHLKHDENIAESENKEGYDRAKSLYHQFINHASWLEPTLLQFESEAFKDLIESEELEKYRFYLTKLLEQKKHVLSKDKEELMSLAQRAHSTPAGAFSALTNVDMDFGSVLDEAGQEHKLTQGSYGKFIKSKDRILRKNASEKLHGTYGLFENTITELINGVVQNHVFNAKARNYESCLQAALKPNHIPVSVYHSLIDTISKNLEPMHRYISLRKKILGVDKLHCYDLHAPLIEIKDKQYSYEEACEIVIDSVSILGKEYQDILAKGLYDQGWVDVYENKGKRSGAYSSGNFDSHPYILLNFQGTLNDVLTLSHEAGHSMNSYLSNKKQHYHDADYTIFVAEVASTFNEQLTYEYLEDRAKDKNERIFLLCQQLDAIRSTFFRQALFAEFEHRIHQMAENYEAITPNALKELYGQLCSKYYGNDLEITEELKSEYLRIPHFYYNFYVYQYSTGIAAAISLVEEVKKGNLQPYLDFLAAGGSDFSTNILKSAGVDMQTEKPFEKTLKEFDSLLKKLEKEFEEKTKNR